jgi:hypothetical protein
MDKWINIELILLIGSIELYESLESFPAVESNELPPDDTVVVEAYITNPPKRKPKKYQRE